MHLIYETRINSHSLFGQSKDKSFRLISSTPLLNVFQFKNPTAMLLSFLSSIVIFSSATLLTLVTTCFHYSRGSTAQGFPFYLIPISSKSFMQDNNYFHFFIIFTCKLGNRLSLFVLTLCYKYDMNAIKTLHLS